MRKIKKITYIGLAIAVASLLFVNAGAMTVDKNNEKNFLEFPNAEILFKENLKVNPIVQTASLSGNIRLSEHDSDDIHPCITKDLEGNIVVAFTENYNILDNRLAWSYSTDNGESWSQIYTEDPTFDTYNDVAVVNGPIYYGLLGVYIQPMDEVECFYQIPDVTSLETWAFYSWSGDAPDVSYACISDNSYLEGQYHEMDGPVNMYIEHLLYAGYDIPSCPNQMIIGFTEDGEIEGGEGTFDGQRDLVTAPAFNADMSNEYMKSHHTWHCHLEDSGEDKIVWKMIIPIEGDTDSTDIEYTPYYAYVGDGTDPAIAHYGDNIAIVYMSNGEIKCAYSSNNGDDWSTSTIDSGGYPDICAVGSEFQCAYVNNGNLYLVASSDGGATWGEQEKVNDVDGTVVEEEGSIDIHRGGIVWTDIRNEDKDIYYASGSAAPEISIATISGGFGVSAEIENAGTADATNVQWSIDLEGGLVIVGSHADGTISTLAAGASQKVKIGFVLGIGGVTITATADGATKTASGTVLGPFVIGVE